MNILVEEWGGKYQCQEVSAKMGKNIDLLLEKVILESDMMDLKANPDRNATGSVIEASMEEGRGYAAAVLVQNGTLKIGDVMLAGSDSGRYVPCLMSAGKKLIMPAHRILLKY